MSTRSVDPNRYQCCALCKRWDGDAKLSIGNTRGQVKFNVMETGTCNIQRVKRVASFGSSCSDFSISPEANRYKL